VLAAGSGDLIVGHCRSGLFAIALARAILCHQCEWRDQRDTLSAPKMVVVSGQPRAGAPAALLTAAATWFVAADYRSTGTGGRGRSWS